MQRIRITPADVGALLAIAVAFLFLFRDLPSPGPYLYDEADYMTAGTRGFTANVLELPSMSVVEFLRVGLNIGMNRARRTGLSDLVRGNRDITFYRHYHGPVYFYWLAAVSSLVHSDEYAMRFSGLIFHILTFAVIYLGVVLLTGSRVAALLSSFLYLFGQSSIGTDTQITPHIAYVFFTVLTLLLFAGYLETGSRRLWYGSIAAFAGAFCSIDYAILLPITFGICLFLMPDRRPPLPVLFRSLLLFLGSLLLVWPIGLVELSAIKGYFYIAYLAMQRKGSYGDGGPVTVWIRRLTAAPVEYSLDVAALVLCLATWRTAALRRVRPVLLPCLIYAFLMLLTTLKNTSINPTYVSSILPPLAIITGVVFLSATGKMPGAARSIVAALLLAAIALGGYSLVIRNRRRPPEITSDSNMLAAIRRSGMERSVLLVPYELLPTVSYYFPGVQLHPYLQTDDSSTILSKLREFKAQGLLYRRRPADQRLPEELSRQFQADVTPVDENPSETLYRIHGRS